MKQSLALIGLTFLSVLSVAFYSGLRFTVIFGIGCTLLFGISLMNRVFRQSIVIPLTFFIAALASLFYTAYTKTQIDPKISAYSNQEADVTAVLQDDPYQAYGNNYYVFKTETINQKKETLKFILRYNDNLKIEPFDKITCTLLLTPANPSYVSQNILFISKINNTFKPSFDYQIITAEKRPVYYYAIQLKRKMIDAIDKTMRPSYGSLAKALVIGEKNSLDVSVKESFRKAGLSHIIAVSGQHLAILSMYLTRLCKKWIKNKYIISSSNILVVIVFMAVTGFSVSIIRAGLTLIVYHAGIIFDRHASSLNSLGFAALVILLFNPYAAGDIGLLLSFSASAGIVLWSQSIGDAIKARLEKVNLFKHLQSYFIDIISVSVSAVLMVTPITLLVFDSFSTVFLIANLLITPAAGLMIISGLLCCIFYYAGPLSPLAKAFAFLNSAFCKYALIVSEALSKIPFSYLHVNDKYVFIWLGATLILAAVMILMQKSRKYLKTVICLSLIIFAAGILSNSLRNLNVTKVTVFNAGNGTTVALSAENKISMMSVSADYLHRYEILNTLSEKEATIDLCIFDDSGKQPRAFAKDILDQFHISSVLLSEENAASTDIKNHLKNTGNVESYSGQYKLMLWNSINVSILSIEGNTYQYFTSRNKTMLILPPAGDCVDLPYDYRKADIIVMNKKLANMNLLEAELVVVSQDEETAKETAGSFPVKSAEAVFTFNGDVVLEI